VGFCISVTAEFRLKTATARRLRILGFAFAAAMAGWLIDNRGTNYAFALGAIATVITFSVTFIGRNKISSKI